MSIRLSTPHSRFAARKAAAKALVVTQRNMGKQVDAQADAITRQEFIDDGLGTHVGPLKRVSTPHSRFVAEAFLARAQVTIQRRLGIESDPRQIKLAEYADRMYE